MGKCEAASASIGIKILLSDLILQINDSNDELIREMLEDGFIDDENDDFNEVFWEIIHNDVDSYNAIEYKEYLKMEFTHKGSYHKTRSGKIIPTIVNGCLLDKYLLVPLTLILRTERWGHDRYGTNASSRSLDFDLSVGTEKYKDIQHTEIVFILKQHSG